MKRLTAAIAAAAAAFSAASAEIVVLDFDDLDGGDVVRTQYDGVRIFGRRVMRDGTTLRGVNRAMVFDSHVLTGEDDDLVGPFRSEDGQTTYDPGNVLIVSEDGDGSDPDDSASGGRLVFRFDAPVTFLGFNAFDINATEAITLRLYGLDGALLARVTNGNRTVGDNAYLSFMNLNVPGVARAVFAMSGSGAIDDITFDTAPVPVPGAMLLFAPAVVGLRLARRRRAA